MKHMIGLYETGVGKVMIHGVDITKADESQLKKIGLDIGVAFQSGGLFGSMTLGENVALPLQEYTGLSGEAIDLVILRKMKLGMVNLAGYETALPEELCGGMKKRAGLARAMALDPTVLF